MRETRRPWRSLWVSRACRAEQCWRASASVARPPPWTPPGRSVRACRWAWAHCVHANASILQVRRPCPRERTHGGFGGAIHTIRRQPSAGDDGRSQDDRGTVRHQRKRLLHREQEPFHIDVEDRVIVLLGDRAEGSILRNTGIREHDIERALLPLDLCEEAIEVAEVRHVSSYAGDIPPDLLDRRRQLRITAPRDEDVRALVHELLRRRQANAAIATSDEGDFPFELPHVFLPC